MDLMCRACMCKNQIFHLLCDEAADKPLTIYEMFATTIPQVPIHSNDELPKKICVACLNTLIIVHKFQQMCITSDTYMRSFLVSNRLACYNSISNSTEQQEEIKHIVIGQETEKLDAPLVTQDPLKSPCSIKVEAIDDAVSESVLLETNEVLNNNTKDSDWSDGDDIPLKKSEILKLNPLPTEEFQNCMKLEISDVEVRECDLKTTLTTIEKNEIVFFKSKDPHSAILAKDLECDNNTDDQREDNTATGSEWTAADGAETNSEGNNGDDNYQKKTTSKLNEIEQQPSISIATIETDIHEIEKPNSSSHRQYKFRCPHCDAAFAGNYKLKQHSSLHDETRPFACEICNYRFKTSTTLAQHKHTHKITPPGGFKCSKCSRRFEKRNSLMSHMRTHREHLFKCNWCTQKFEKLSRLTLHLRRHESENFVSENENDNTDTDFEWSIGDDNDCQEKSMSELPKESKTDQHPIQFNVNENTNETRAYEIEKPNAQFFRKYNFRCEHCNAAFASNYKLQHHARVHVETNPFVCEACNYRYRNASALALHTAVRHETAPPEGYKCPECPRLFERSISLKRHVTSHRHRKTVPELFLFKCNFCPKKFQKSSALTQHARLHPENQKYKCTVCVASFGLGSQLEDHMHKHNGLKSLICEHCKKEFKKKTSLRDHLRKHSGERPYLCPQCGKSFRTTTGLSDHRKRHSDVKNYQCPECPRKFACRSDQIKHMEVHRDIRPHSCNICGSSFTRASSLKKHKFIHTGERPHKCNECNMKFACIYKLRLHQRTHTGDKPYKCKHCQKAYALKGDLNKHIRVHVGDKIYICEECPEKFKYRKEFRKHQSAHYKQKK